MIANIYPTLDAALLSSLRAEELEPTAPDADMSDEDNANVVLPSYDDVISGKVWAVATGKRDVIESIREGTVSLIMPSVRYQNVRFRSQFVKHFVER